jgi:hypothetical protein
VLSRRTTEVLVLALFAMGASGCGKDWEDTCSKIQAKADACSAELGKTVDVSTCDPAVLEKCDNEDDVADAIEPCLEESDCKAFDECYPFTLFCVQQQ